MWPHIPSHSETNEVPFMYSMTSQKIQRTIFILCALIIPVALMVTFTYYPAVKLIYYSFSEWDGLRPNVDWMGLKNWIYLLHNSDVFGALSHSLYYIAGGLVQNALALFLAIILNKKSMPGKHIFRGIIVLPFILNGTAVSYMFRYIYDYTKGPLNIILQFLGIQPVRWLSNPATVNWALAAVALWRYSGYLMVIYLAGLQSIPADYYEAATIDGANSWQSFRYITIPQLTDVIKLQMFLNISGAVNVFDLPFVITSGGPMGSSMTLAMRANELAFDFNNYGLASTYGVFCTAVIIVIYCLQDKILYGKEKKL